jgi:hypothetical protein
VSESGEQAETWGWNMTKGSNEFFDGVFPYVMGITQELAARLDTLKKGDRQAVKPLPELTGDHMTDLAVWVHAASNSWLLRALTQRCKELVLQLRQDLGEGQQPSAGTGV